jgi:hypothetical protein
MAHPIHFHGQRFAVVSRNGVPNDNLVWKDSALLLAGETMDILLELSNPGKWMAHCHVAELLGTGMMFAFTVDPQHAARWRRTDFPDSASTSAENTGDLAGRCLSSPGRAGSAP